MNLSFVVLVFGATIIVAESKNVKADEKSIYCYFESWTVYRPGNGKFDVDHIDPSLCTHIAFTFIGLHENGSILIIDPWQSDPDGLDGFRRLISLKDSSPSLKVLISMGGWNEGSLNYSKVAADPARRAIMIGELIKLIDRYGFDGFDFDWEYPARRDSNNTEDRANFVIWLRELQAVLQPRGLILSAAVNGAKANIDISYDVPALNELLDHINIMSYDFHGEFDNYVGHHTPLYSAKVDKLYNNTEWNINDGIKYWIESGADPIKMNLGIATYARTFTLLDPTNTSLYASITGGGLAGPYTRMDGIMGYNEICELHGDIPDVWDAEQKVPHKVIGDQWIGYESVRSVAVKVDYALQMQLGGFMLWSFDTDDFRGLCGGGPYPLLSTIHSVMAKNGYRTKTNH